MNREREGKKKPETKKTHVQIHDNKT